MGWSIKLFDVGGTAVRLHMTFFLLLAWIGAIQWARGGAVEAVDGVIFILLLFVSVVLHEFGHVFAARRYGINTPESDFKKLHVGDKIDATVVVVDPTYYVTEVKVK